jgi:hypothetical protein
MDTKDWGPVQKFKGPQDIYCKDHLARSWGALLATRLTQQRFYQESPDIKSTKIGDESSLKTYKIERSNILSYLGPNFIVRNQLYLTREYASLQGLNKWPNKEMITLNQQ